MGVDHGGDRGDKSPQNLERETLMQIAPPPILSYRYKNERSVAFKIRQNPFSVGDLPRTPLGNSRRSPRPLSRLERGHPSPYPTQLGTDPPSALAMRPPRSPARSTPMLTTLQVFLAKLRCGRAPAYTHFWCIQSPGTCLVAANVIILINKIIYNEELSYCRDSASRRSLRRSR